MTGCVGLFALEHTSPPDIGHPHPVKLNLRIRSFPYTGATTRLVCAVDKYRTARALISLEGRISIL